MSIYLRRILLLASLSLAAYAPALGQNIPEYMLRMAEPDAFDSAIEKFLAQDQVQMPPQDSILFTGSSSILMWRTLSEDMAPYPIINRGFGGSHLQHMIRHFDSIVSSYKPKAIFLYCGENDLAAGDSVDTIIEEFETFLKLKDEALPDVPLYFISIKPSILRWDQFSSQTEANDQVKALAEERTDLFYVDIVDTMLINGKPKEIFIGDNLHMNQEGYALWTEIISPIVTQIMQ